MVVCGARLIGGILSTAMFPAVTAYVADVTTEDERSRGMAWEGTAVSLGVVFGPALAVCWHIATYNSPWDPLA